MNKILKYSLILVLAITRFSIGQDFLDRYLTIAAENNPGLKAKYHEYQASLEKIPQVGTLPDPQVSFGYFIQPVETRVGPQQARISVVQMFPWFGTLGTEKNVAVQEAKAKYEVFEESKSKLFYEIRSNYFRLYFIKRNISITLENLDILQSIKDLVMAEIIGGKASVADELQLEIELGDLQNELIKSRELYISEEVKFKNLLNVSPDHPIEILDSLPDKDLSFSEEEIKEKIRSNNPELLQLDYLRQSYIAKEKVARKNGLPKFSLGLDYIFVGERNSGAAQVEDNGKDAIVFPMLSFSLPLYRGKYSGQKNEARLRQQAAERKMENTENLLESMLQEAQWQYRDADRRINLYNQQQALARKALSIMEADYQKQNKSLEDLLSMERKVINYGLAAEKALAEKQTTIAQIYYLMGE